MPPYSFRGSGVRIPLDPQKVLFRRPFRNLNQRIWDGRSTFIRQFSAPYSRFCDSAGAPSSTNDETVCPTDFESNLSLSELAARLGVSAQTNYDLRSHGRGPHGFRIGR